MQSKCIILLPDVVKYWVYLKSLRRKQLPIHYSLRPFEFTLFLQGVCQNYVVMGVLGSKKMQAADRDKMPYTYAVLHEVMRIRTLASLGLVHTATEDLELGEFSSC